MSPQLEAIEKDFAEIGPRVVSEVLRAPLKPLRKPERSAPSQRTASAAMHILQERDAEAARQEELRKMEERKKRVEAQKAERCASLSFRAVCDPARCDLVCGGVKDNRLTVACPRRCRLREQQEAERAAAEAAASTSEAATVWSLFERLV